MSRDLCAMMEKGRFACVGDIKAIILKQKKEKENTCLIFMEMITSQNPSHINLVVMPILGQVMLDLP